MKKKIAFLIASVLCAGIITSCGSTQDVPGQYGDYTEADLESSAMSYASQLITLDGEVAAQQAEYMAKVAKTSSGQEAEQAKMYAAMLDGWAKTEPLVGEFEGFGDFTIDKTGKTLTTTLNLDFAERDAQLVTTYKVFNMMVSSININPVYSLGETMGRAAQNTIIGLCTVFVVLILISLLISCFKLIYIAQNRKEKAAKEEKPATPTVSQTAAPAAASSGDKEIAAAIAAALCAASEEAGEPTDSFVVRHIRRR